MHGQGLPGFRDFYPEETALRNHIFGVWRSVAARYGFVEYDGPPLEALELYTEKSGDEIVAQLYTFEDKGGRQVALRPEMTPSLARMVAARARGMKKPIRWFSIPQLFRYERQQRGRLREHYQLNMDLIGEPGPLADAEIIGASIDVMRGLGLGVGDVRVRISDRRVVSHLLRRAGVPDTALPDALVALDKIDREPHDRLRARLTTSGVSTEAANRTLELGAVRGADALRDTLRGVPDGEETGEGLFACVDALGAMGLGDFVDIDLSIVRGLAYYTGIVFELFDARGTFRAICGGGRYDGLLERLGGVDLPGTGFGMGDVVLGELLRDRDLVPTLAGNIDAFLIAVSADDMPTVLELAHVLREHGRDVEFALKEQAVGKQLKLAAARGARHAVIVGPDERAAEEGLVRNLETGSEHRVTFARMHNGRLEA